MEILESARFAKLADDYLNDEDLNELKLTLAINTNAGVVIPGSGGCRKLRWMGRRRGKRGGYRIIYFFRSVPEQVWLLTIYAKNDVVNISAAILKKWKREIES